MQCSKLRSIRSPRRRWQAVSAVPRGRGARALDVDEQLELGRLHNRQVGRLGTLEDAAEIRADLPECIRKIWPVAHQSTDLGKLALRVDCGNCMVGREMDQ